MNQRKTRFAGMVAAALAVGCALPAPTAPETSAALDSMTPRERLRLHAARAGGFATAVNEQGVPTFLWAGSAERPPAGATPESAARFHVARFREALGLSPSALETAGVARVLPHRGGSAVVHLRQRVSGVEIHRRELRLLLRGDGSLVAIAGSLHPDPVAALAAGKGATFRGTASGALAAALSHATGVAVAGRAVIDLHAAEDDREFFQIDERSGVELSDRALARKVLWPDGASLRPAWVLEFYAARAGSGDTPAWRYVIADDTFAVLSRVSLTQSDTFDYRVWAWQGTGDKRPLDGPIADYTPHPTGRADWLTPPFVPPSLVAMAGFNKPSSGKPDPWLPSNASASTGNNVDAYTDRHPPNGPGGGDFRAQPTAPGVFDYTYDLTAPPTANDGQAMAGIMQAFYDTNWLHDYWYDSGFNEVAGNAQLSNYGRGGVGGDRMQVQTQDYSGRDNSNMSTPGDGLSPQMQLYVWSGRDQHTLRAQVDQEPVKDQPVATAVFGPQLFPAGQVPGEGVLAKADDGTFPSTTDACEPIRNGDMIMGHVALIDRGTCTFKRKALNAQNAGAIAVLIVNNVDGDPPTMGNGDPMAQVIDIPILATTRAAGALLRSALDNQSEVKLTFSRARDIDRDGTLDNTVVFHEWGHYLHHRLADCELGHQCNAMSEGWADFNALHTIARDTDNLDGTYGVGIYASAQFDDPAYFGIRRQPYSTDFHKNGITFKHIGDGVALPDHQPRNGGGANSEVHNAGEVWTTMLWEAYVALQKSGRARGLGFDEVRRRMADYVVAGHQMEPMDDTYTEARDAVMAAAGAADPEDQQAIAEGFARRGAGTCADSPPRSSDNLQGVVEGFTVQARLVVDAVTLDDSLGTCTDKDGVLDAGERGKLVIHLSNGALKPLSGATLTVATTTPQATISGATSFPVPTLMPFATTTVTTEVTLDPAMAQPTTLQIQITPSSDAACDNAAALATFPVNYDVAKQALTHDDVESADSPWKPTGTGATDVWSRLQDAPRDHVWHAVDGDGTDPDTALESPDLVVRSDAFFLIRFEHRFSFDARDANGQRIYIDGGVMEITRDGGKHWEDISKYADPGYNGAIPAIPDHPLAKRKAWVDLNFATPKRDRVTMNFLDAFAGETIRIRFRIGTDDTYNQAATGWDIDNLSFEGLANTPFSGAVIDAGTCGTGPRGSNISGGGGGGCAVATGRAPGIAMLFGGLALLGLFLRRRLGRSRAPYATR